VGRSYWIGGGVTKANRQKLKITTLESAGLHDNAGAAAFGRTESASPAQQGTENRKLDVREFKLSLSPNVIPLFDLS